ncbi:DUF5343 domain-containing protein [Shewanella baltica]|uniref:DUF5343 domain-containing protein n=1 Tax=Shewanella baltica (strain OS155 / ATCC BAA-1091) TaxID=325240 RepID=A3D5V2_SHEB5|nr:DUF5343 domain-containing protein [Shewanella baltica]ABN62115.1 conserved hypothetical protein [Shewanella baltica OS155]AEH14461.1 hypothetical protein Sbal117_2759 [Shewanella baltica OS117]
MADNLPYSTSVGTFEKMLDKIKAAPAPERFTQDFVGTKLSMKGGTANACIPLLKKMGFVAGDGSPTSLYKEFRNPAKSRIALGTGFRKLYSRLYQMNEYIHDANDQDVLGLIVECTGSEHDNAATKYTLSTFNMLRKHADFDNEEAEVDLMEPEKDDHAEKYRNPIAVNMPQQPSPQQGKGINLSYTINLNLPATKDIEVFNAIFKSLKEHILEE